MKCPLFIKGIIVLCLIRVPKEDSVYGEIPGPVAVPTICDEKNASHLCQIGDILRSICSPSDDLPSVGTKSIMRQKKCNPASLFF